MPQIVGREICGVGGTVEEMVNRVGEKAALRTGGVHHLPYLELEIEESGAVA